MQDNEETDRAQPTPSDPASVDPAADDDFAAEKAEDDASVTRRANVTPSTPLSPLELTSDDASIVPAGDDEAGDRDLARPACEWSGAPHETDTAADATPSVTPVPSNGMPELSANVLPADDGGLFNEFDPSPQNLAREQRHLREEQELQEPFVRAHERVEAMRQPWQQNAPELAEWTLRYQVNRTDAWGGYLSMSRRDEGRKAITAPRVADRGRITLTPEVICRHFEGYDVGNLIGLHAIGADNRCKWVAWDIDRHDHDPNPPDPAANLNGPDCLRGPMKNSKQISRPNRRMRSGNAKN